jgi:hypothetical protein
MVPTMRGRSGSRTPDRSRSPASGFATWNLEYQRLGNDGGGWPGTFQDIASGADHLRQIAVSNQLDLTRVVAHWPEDTSHSGWPRVQTPPIERALR